MKKSIETALVLVILLLAGGPLSAQQVEMADTMRSEGKIYVVVAMILIVLGGLIVYLLLMDRKLSRLEKMIDERQKTNSR